MIKNRNLLVQVLLMMVTFGLYSIYWFYQTSVELKFKAQDSEVSPALWTILLIFPPLSLYSFYKYSEVFEKVASDKFNKWILFILFLVLMPAVWFIVQTELNRFADRQAV